MQGGLVLEKKNAEAVRLGEGTARTKNWKRWGSYLAERQWATVREDYSPDGTCWEYFPHDHARSRAYRWGEDGRLGITDRQCRLCFALTLWNERDPILKERLFGLTGPEGNHGEDVKAHLHSRDILSVPDKWGYPWFAAWDLAFHMLPFARIDSHFAKEELVLLLREWYLHPLSSFWVSQIGMLAGTIVCVNAGKELAQIDSLAGILSPGGLISFAVLGLFPITVKKLLALYKRKIRKSSESATVTKNANHGPCKAIRNGKELA